MSTHQNARTTPPGRALMVRRVEEEDWPVAAVAPASVVSVRKGDAGSRGLRAVLKSGSTTANGATRVLSTSHAVYDDRVEVDPATGTAWTKAGVNALKPGAEVAAWPSARSAKPRSRCYCGLRRTPG